jgi:hypothetical protein
MGLRTSAKTEAQLIEEGYEGRYKVYFRGCEASLEKSTK